MQNDKCKKGSLNNNFAFYISNFALGLSRFTFYVLRFLPAYLYLLSTLMFAVVNLARGYLMAGLIGALVLRVVGWRWRSRDQANPDCKAL